MTSLDVSPIGPRDGFNPHAPFTVRESALRCGTTRVNDADKTSLGIDFQIDGSQTTVFDQQSIDTLHWSIRVEKAALYQSDGNCADCDGTSFEYVVVAR